MLYSGHLATERGAMVGALAERERTVSELAAPYAMSLAAASKHIKVLEGAGLVRRTVHGRTHTIWLNPDCLAEADEWLRRYERFWTDRLDRLERLFPERQEGPE